MKPEASSDEILRAYQDNPDWRGELFKIVDRGQSKFVKKYNLKWNDDKRLLFFFYFLKLFLNNIGNRSMFREVFGVTPEDYPGLNLRAASAEPLFLSLNDDKAVSMVNEMLDIMELPAMDAKQVTREKNKLIRELRNRWLRNIFKDKNRIIYEKAITLKIESLNRKKYSINDALKEACLICEADFSKKIESSFKNYFYGNGMTKRGWEVLQDLEDALKGLREKPQNS